MNATLNGLSSQLFGWSGQTDPFGLLEDMSERSPPAAVVGLLFWMGVGFQNRCYPTFTA